LALVWRNAPFHQLRQDYALPAWQGKNVAVTEVKNMRKEENIEKHTRKGKIRKISLYGNCLSNDVEKTEGA